MKYIQWLLVCFCLVMPIQGSKKLILIETAGNDPYVFDFFIQSAKKAGFVVDFCHLYSKECPNLSEYDAIFLALDAAVLVACLKLNMHNKESHPLAQKLLEVFVRTNDLKNKVVGIMLPNVMKPSPALVQIFQNLCKQLCFLDDAEHAKMISDFIELTMQPDSILRSWYDTSMLSADSPTLLAQKKYVFDGIIDFLLVLGTLPYNHRSLQTSGTSFALYVKNNKNNNQYVFTKKSLLTFKDIEENFLFSPLDNVSRKHLSNQLSLMMHQLYQACECGSLSKKNLLQGLTTYALKKNVKKESTLETTQRKIVCGWADPDSYSNKEESSVKNLTTMGLNLLWMEWNPEWYVSRQGMRQTDQNKLFLKIDSFTKALAHEKEEGKKLPQLFMGTDITSNFAQANVLNPVHDIFGTIYSKIPSPLDFKSFWKPEVLDVFDKMYTCWHEKIGNGISLDGIFFDFEMYHAQDQASQYTPLMDFSPLAWRCFIKSKPEAAEILPEASVHERVAFLMKNNYFDDYFFCLRSKAERIGQKIKNHLRAKMPEIKLAAYNMHLPHSWFYQGFCAGLSSADDPLIMATFNTKLGKHAQWLQERNIYIKHLPVLLLSKLKKKRDFSLIRSLMNKNDGIWFNRISRLEEPRDPAQWRWNYAVEVSPLHTEEFIFNLNESITQTNNNN